MTSCWIPDFGVNTRRRYLSSQRLLGLSGEIPLVIWVPPACPIRISMRARAHCTLRRILALTVSRPMRTRALSAPGHPTIRSLEMTVCVAIEAHLVRPAGFGESRKLRTLRLGRGLGRC